MEELPGGRGSGCVALRRRIEAPAAFQMLTYHADQLYAELPDRWDGQFEGRGPPG